MRLEAALAPAASRTAASTSLDAFALADLPQLLYEYQPRAGGRRRRVRMEVVRARYDDEYTLERVKEVLL